MTKRRNLQLTGMSWLRNVTRRSGACLAMLALIVQLAASFGHVHARDFAAGTGSDMAGIWHKRVAVRAVASSPEKLADDEDHCPICFSGFLLATSFVPQAAQPVPCFDLSDISYAGALASSGTPDSGRPPFQPRAPPSA